LSTAQQKGRNQNTTENNDFYSCNYVRKLSRHKWDPAVDR